MQGRLPRLGELERLRETPMLAFVALACRWMLQVDDQGGRPDDTYPEIVKDACTTDHAASSPNDHGPRFFSGVASAGY